MILKNLTPENTVLVSIKMLSNKVRNDSFWLIKCFEYLAGNVNIQTSWSEPTLPETARVNFADFRRVLEERLGSYVADIEALEAKLEKEKARVSLEITEKAVPVGPVHVVQHTNQFVEVLAPPTPKPAWPSALTPVPVAVVSPTRVAVVKESAPVPVPSPVKATVIPLPEPEEEPEAEEEEEEEVEEEEEEEEPEPEENYEQIRIKKRTYWLETNSRKVYEITPEGDVGDLVANYLLVNGVQTLAPL